MNTDMYELGDQVDDAVTELLTLWPKLADALERDSGASDGERVSGSVSVHLLPVNIDVVDCVRVIHAEAWPAAWEARTVLNEPAEMVSLERTIESLGILYRRLVGQGYNGDARKLAAKVLCWHRTARTAVGLSRRAAPLQSDDGPVMCPLHDAPLMQLRQRGDEGTVDEGARGDREAIRWQRGGGLYCPLKDCKGAWGPSEYPFLGRLVAEQRLRLTRQESA